jgi:hypothetical protein
VTGFRGRGETIGRLEPAVGGGVPRRQGVALADKGLQPLLELAERLAEMVFQRTDRIPAEQALGGVVQQFPQRLAGRQNLVLLANLKDEQTVLSDREGLVPPRSAAPHRLMRARLCARSSSVQQSK